MNQFRDLGLSAPILRALDEQGYTTPTPIQAGTIGPALDGRDILGCAQTGTGKTAAFALPIIHMLHEQRDRSGRRAPAQPRALVLSPTRELATQIADAFAVYGRHTGLRCAAIFGGVSQRKQERAMERGVDVVVAAPGRLLDLLEQGVIDLSRVEVLVLDEADRMLDMGFINPIRRIASEIADDRQTLLFSATMPGAIRKLADSLLSEPVRVSVTPVASAAPRIEQSLYLVARPQKEPLLRALLEDASVERAIVFTRTKHGADRLSKRLSRSGVASDSIHGNKSQSQRERALLAFRSGRARVLVATDVAARGLDVDGITHVFNFELPNDAEAYVHRIGRTARAGAEGAAISFCDGEERGQLRAIERLLGAKIGVVPTPRGLAPLADAAPEREPAQQQDAPRAQRPGGQQRRPRPAGGRARAGGPRPGGARRRQRAARG